MLKKPVESWGPWLSELLLQLNTFMYYVFQLRSSVTNGMMHGTGRDGAMEGITGKLLLEKRSKDGTEKKTRESDSQDLLMEY